MAPGGSTQELFAAVGSVFLSVAAARQGFAPFAWAAFRRHEPRKRRRPSAPVMQIVALAAQDVRILSARQVRASAAANLPSEFQGAFVAPDPSFTRR